MASAVGIATGPTSVCVAGMGLWSKIVSRNGSADENQGSRTRIGIVTRTPALGLAQREHDGSDISSLDFFHVNRQVPGQL